MRLSSPGTCLAVAAEVAVDDRADVDQIAGTAEPIDDESGMIDRLGRGSPIRHEHAQETFRTDRLGHQERDQRRVDAAR